MSDELFPESDRKFARSAECFAKQIGASPERYFLPGDDVRAIVEAVDAYVRAFEEHAKPFTRSVKTRLRKDLARAAAEAVMRPAANQIRVNPKVDAALKVRLAIKQRPAKLRARACPQTAPALRFLGSVQEGHATSGMHRIAFRHVVDGKVYRAKPRGATRIELFYDHVPPNEPIPKRPGDRWGGRKLYLRSYARSPMIVDFPKCDEPMHLVYWARWADAAGETGPFSEPLETRLEGCLTPKQLGRLDQVVTVTTLSRPVPRLVDESRVEPMKLLPGDAAEAA